MERSKEIEIDVLQQINNHVGEEFSGLVRCLLETMRNFPSFGSEIYWAASKYTDAVERGPLET